jgi:hypothetical protein
VITGKTLSNNLKACLDDNCLKRHMSAIESGKQRQLLQQAQALSAELRGLPLDPSSLAGVPCIILGQQGPGGCLFFCNWFIVYAVTLHLSQLNLMLFTSSSDTGSYGRLCELVWLVKRFAGTCCTAGLVAQLDCRHHLTPTNLSNSVTCTPQMLPYKHFNHACHDVMLMTHMSTL